MGPLFRLMKRESFFFPCVGRVGERNFVCDFPLLGAWESSTRPKRCRRRTMRAFAVVYLLVRQKMGTIITDRSLQEVSNKTEIALNSLVATAVTCGISPTATSDSDHLREHFCQYF